MSKPRVRKTPSSPQKAKPTKKLKANMAALAAYSSTSALNDTLMKTVKHQYENRDITNVKTAKAAMDLLKANEFNKFTKKFASISKLVSNKSAKRAVKREAREFAEQEKMDREVKGIEKVVYKPTIKISGKGTEAPTYEIEFKRDYRNIVEAWEAAERKLIKMTEEHMKNKPNINGKLKYPLNHLAIRTT